MEPLPPIIHESWHTHLQPLFDDPKMKMIKFDILPKAPFLPTSQNIFRVFSMPLDKIKVVALGQDPYPTPGDAIGLAFAVNGNRPIPKSLQIIFAETTRSIKGAKVDRTLQHWVDQGVFLLNTALTVEATKAGSHMDYWGWFTAKVVEIISNEVTPIWLLWGKKAQGYKHLIRESENFLVNSFLECDHPAAEVYNGGTSKTKFSGSNVFVKCNEELINKGLDPIAW